MRGRTADRRSQRMLLKPERSAHTRSRMRKRSARDQARALRELVPPSPAESARKAALRYVSDRRPGIRRVRSGKGFRYVLPDGMTLRDADELRRIRVLVFPPAWRDVWICPLADGHLQATGRDAKGRKQYRYHGAWRTERDTTKYTKMIAFGHALLRVRARVAEDLARPGLPKEKVLATIVRLLETTLIRVGNEEYARSNQSYGLTTLRNRHVDIDVTTNQNKKHNKNGKRHAIDVTDRRLAQIVKRCRDLPGYELFEYIDEQGAVNSVTSADVNAYLRDIAGEEFTAKDFRTWNGTVLAAEALLAFEAFTSESQAKRNINEAIQAVSRILGNTKAICRKCYVHPAVIVAYLAGTLKDKLHGVGADTNKTPPAALNEQEQAVLVFLEGVLVPRPARS